MAYQKPGGGGVSSDEVNATKANVLAGKTALTSDSNDDVGTGTLPLSSVLSSAGGSIPSKESATYNVSGSDQAIASGQYLSGNQTIKAVTTSNIDAGNIKKGVTVKVGDSNNSGRIKSVTGTWYGNKATIASGAMKGVNSEATGDGTFTMPSAGTVYYGGYAYMRMSSGVSTCRIYKNTTLMNSRDINNDYESRSTMINQSFSADAGDVITVSTSVTSGSGSSFIQAVIVY